MNSKISPIIIGSVEKLNGKKKITFAPSQQKLLNKHLESLEGYVTVDIKKRTQKRSIDQNALLWFWLTCLEHETGQPKEDIHDYYKNKLLKRWVTVKGKRVEVVGGTSTMNSEEFSYYLEAFKDNVAKDFEYILPNNYPH